MVSLVSAAAAAAAKLFQSCPTLCDPRDGSPPGSAVPGILQARTLEWVPLPSPVPESEKFRRTKYPPTLSGSFYATSSFPGPHGHLVKTLWI